MIQEEGSACNDALVYLYQQHRDAVEGFLKGRGAKKEEVEDVFQEGIICMVLNIQEGRFKGKSSIKTYLYAIAKQILFKKQQKKQPVLGLEFEFQEEELDVSGDQLLLTQEQQLELEKVLGQLSPKCRTALRMWAMHYSMKEISQELGFSNEQVARNHKSRCLKRIQQIMEDNPHLKKLLQELV